MLREELKKIWQPGILIAIILIGGVFYWMFLAFSIDHFPNGPYNDGLFQIATELVETYGTSLELDEFEEFASTLPALEAEADEYLKVNPVAQEHGITSYAKYVALFEESDELSRYSEDSNDPAQAQYASAQLIQNYLTSDEAHNIYGRIRATEEYIREYKVWEQSGIDLLTSPQLSANTEQEYVNAKKLFFAEDNAWQNILPPEILEATGTYFSYLLVWMVLSLCILLSPVLVRDRMRKMRPLQWSSQRGRGVLKYQFAAIMVSAIMLTTANALLFGGLFLTNGTLTFAACKMFSFMMTGYSWVNWSYGAWCCVLIAICYIVSLGVTGIVFIISNHSANYITMLMKLIPVFVAAAVISTKLIYFAFYYNNALYALSNIPMAELAPAVIIFSVGLILPLISIVVAKRRNLLAV